MKRIIYQALTRLWGGGRFSDWDDASLDYVKSLGADYIWYTGIPRHATGKDFVKGDPGSPYAVTDWMDVNPYMADEPERRLDEFEALVGRTHRHGLKVIIDFVPNHVARDYRGGLPHHEWCDYDWTDTCKVDWSDPRTPQAAGEILDFWISKGVDGFRCDMVELVPAEALKALISAQMPRKTDILFVAEVYERSNYRRYVDAGFDLIYDKCGLYDRLHGICCEGGSARDITRNWQSLQDLQPKMLNFLENHDERRLASANFLGSARKAFAALGVSLLFNDASFMIYFGQEAGEDAREGSDGRTSIFEWSKPRGIDLLHTFAHGGEVPEETLGLIVRYREMLSLAATPLFRRGSNWDLCYCNEGTAGFDPDRHFAFARFDDKSAAVVFCNFSGSPAGVVLNIPEEIRERLGGSGRVGVEAGPWDSRIYFLV